jgi:oxygen-independent coproporphyrinogen-3 oxidase
LGFTFTSRFVRGFVLTATSRFLPARDKISSQITSRRFASNCKPRCAKAAGAKHARSLRIFFGGGTPTYLSPEVLNELLQFIRDEHPVAADVEISLEANPENLCDREYSIETLRSAGWNRISLGAQSFDDEALLRIGRRHTSTQIEEAVTNARAAGFDNISLDLMFALPGQSRDSWRETLNRALVLAPEHLSCYALTIEGNTLFARRVDRGQAYTYGRGSSGGTDAGRLRPDARCWSRTL